METSYVIDAPGTLFAQKYDIDLKKLEFRREWKKDRAELAALKTITKEERSEIRDFLNREGISEEERRENLALLKTIIDGFSELYKDWLTEEERKEELELLDMLESDVTSDKLSPFDWDPDLWERQGDVDALPFHPAANLFPRMSRADLELLKADIATNGLRSPITLCEIKTDDGEKLSYILDGRHRYEACMLAGVEPRFVAYEGQKPRGFVLSQNVNRRHLTESQRAMSAAELANMRQGSRTDLGPSADLQEVSQEYAAAWCKVSVRMVGYARSIIRQDLTLAEQVKFGEKTVHNALQTLKKAAQEAAREGAQAPSDRVGTEEANSPRQQQNDEVPQEQNQEPADELSMVLSDLRDLGIDEDRLSTEYVRDLQRLLVRLCALKGWEVN